MNLSRRMPRHLRQARQAMLLCLALSVVCGCQEVAEVRIVAPASLAGGTIVVDGESWGELRMDGNNATNTVAVAPHASHHVVIHKQGYKPIVRDVSYSGYGTWQLTIATTELHRDR